MAGNLLLAIALLELIAENDEEYEVLVLELATNSNELAEVNKHSRTTD